MTRGLVRYQRNGDFHFVTFSCAQRRPLLARPGFSAVFEEALERMRLRYGFVVAGYVLMPEHVHLLVGEPKEVLLGIALQALKLSVSVRVGMGCFWLARYYDFNVHSPDKRVEKLRYMHRNPVKRGLVMKPEDWPWSSWNHYATGVRGTVEIESEWTARRRERWVPGLGEEGDLVGGWLWFPRLRCETWGTRPLASLERFWSRDTDLRFIDLREAQSPFKLKTT
jgi:putative transposase